MYSEVLGLNHKVLQKSESLKSKTKFLNLQRQCFKIHLIILYKNFASEKIVKNSLIGKW